MKRRVPGLNQQAKSRSQLPDGVVLVSVHRILYINGQKPYFAISFKILQPQAYVGLQISTRLYCTEKALWKLHWFLKEFNYDPKMLDQDEIDEKALLGLRGVVKISRASVNGRTFTNLDAFAPESAWNENGRQNLEQDQSALEA